MTGLAVVLVLITLASVIFSSANREEPVSAVGAPNAVIVANIADTPATTAKAREKDEPLAELGVAPSVASTATPSTDSAATPR